MLTDRLRQIKIEIQEKNETSSIEDKVLEILNHMDGLEEVIASSKSKGMKMRGHIFEMIIKPAGKNCPTCGRTIEMI